jgi:hypothetical protein
VPTKKQNWRTDIDGLRYVVFRRGTKFGWGVAAPGRKIDWRPQLYHTMDDAGAAACLDYCLRDKPEPNAEQARARRPMYASWRLAPDIVLEPSGRAHWICELGVPRIRFAVSRTGTGEWVWRAYEMLGNHRDIPISPDCYATVFEAQRAAVIAYMDAAGIDLSKFV